VDFALNDHGAFLLEAEHSRPDPKTGEPRPVGVSYAEVSNPYPREYARLEPDVERLGQLARITGGTVDPKAPALFDPGDEKIVHREALWSKILWAALVLFLLDLLVRRVRLFDRRPRLALTPARRHT
jgi:hypothetical protein